MKNIRQLYNELVQKHDTLSHDYIELQRLLKRIVLTAKYNKAENIHADVYVIQTFSDASIDSKKLMIEENVEQKRIEIIIQ